MKSAREKKKGEKVKDLFILHPSSFRLLVALLLLGAAGACGAEAAKQVASPDNARDNLSLRPTLPAVTKTHDVDYGTFEAPEDFAFRRTGTIDSFMGALTRESDGFTIHFDIGLMAGTHVSWMTQDKFALFRLHTVGGSFAYTGIKRVDGKQTVATTICDWCERGRRSLEESAAIRELPPDQREERFRELNDREAQRDKKHQSPANFWADFRREEDLVEFMLIVNSYRPKVMSTVEDVR